MGVRMGLIIEREGHRTDEISRRSQRFADLHEMHSFCSGLLLRSHSKGRGARLEA